jgi:hypothetical protein
MSRPHCAVRSKMQRARSRAFVPGTSCSNPRPANNKFRCSPSAGSLKLTHPSDLRQHDQWPAAARLGGMGLFRRDPSAYQCSEEAGAAVRTLAPGLELVMSACFAKDSGLEITPAPPGKPPPLLPVDQREWLTIAEASELAGVAARSLSQWWRAGLMPATHRVGKHRLLYSRTDIERVMSAARHGHVGVSWSAVRAAIATEKARRP